MIEWIQTIFQNPLGYILALIITAIGLKEGVTFVKWFVSWIKSLFKPKEDMEARFQQNEKEIAELKANQEKQDKEFKRIRDSLDILIESDKTKAKKDIVAAHRKFVPLKGIGYYDLDCLEREYKIYSQEGGNSYVEDLMKDLRALPLVTPANQDIEIE